MTRIIAGGSLFVLTAWVALAQSSATRPEFEVASVKPAQPSTDGRMMVRMGGDPGRVTFTNVSLKDLVRRAYNVKDYQISGPDWIGSTRFDVTATHPPGTPRETVNLMMQALLQDRFKMVVHIEKKVLPAYALTEAKGGFKLTPVAEEPPPAAANPGSSGGGRGMMKMGRGHFEAKGVAISNFADMLLNWVGRPVVDTTGIKGLYDFTLDFTPDENSLLGQRMMAEGRPLAGGPEFRPEVKEGAAEAPSIFAALQEKLGLKLEARKEPVDIVVIDRVEKVPTEN